MTKRPACSSTPRPTVTNGFEQGAIAGGIGGGLQGGIAAAKSNRFLLTGNKLYRDRKTGASL